MSSTSGVRHLPEGFRYLSDFLLKEDVVDWMNWVERLPFQHRVARGRRMKRGSVMFGFEYITDGRRLRPVSSLPDRLDPLVRAIAGSCPAGISFNQCIVTRYPGGAGIGWHTDAAAFGGCIAGLSLGGEARFLLRRRGKTTTSHALTATAGSLYVMAGPSRWDYEHSLKPVQTTRYSLTFRHVSDPTS